MGNLSLSRANVDHQAVHLPAGSQRVRKPHIMLCNDFPSTTSQVFRTLSVLGVAWSLLCCAGKCLWQVCHPHHHISHGPSNIRAFAQLTQAEADIDFDIAIKGTHHCTVISEREKE